MKDYTKIPIPPINEKVGWKNLKAKTIDEPLVCLNDYLLVNPVYNKRYKHGNSQILAREGVADLLVKINKSLKKKYDFQLLIWDALRPPILQKEVFLDIEKRMLKKYMSKKIARKKTLERYFPPVAGAPHNAGSAVDLCLADKKGKAIYMGSTLDEVNDRAEPLYYEYNCESEKNKLYRNYRRILYWAMREYDFEMHQYEWWHFSYLDRYWLAMKKIKNPQFNCPIYGPVIKQDFKI